MRKMKESGIEYLNLIPQKWSRRKYKNVADSRMGETILKSDTAEFGVPIYSATNDNKIFGYLSNPKVILHKGDIVIPARGTIGKATYIEDEIATCTQTTIGSYNISCNSKYLYYCIIALNEQWFHSEKTSVPLITIDQLNNVWIPFPDSNEQEKIVSFLDKKTIELNKVIEKTKETIEDYKKIKYSLIFNKITKGMKKNIELKETGNIYIGKIPSNWNAKKIKNIFEIKKDIAGKEGYDILSITQNGIKIKDVSKNEGQLAANYSNYQLVEVGDFAMNHMDLLTGWVDISKYNGVTSPDYRVFRFINRENNDSKYYLYLMQMCYMGRIFYDLGQGVSNLGRWRLQSDKFLNFVVPSPPIKEQKEISNYLERKCNEIDKLILNKEKLIEELEQYKKSLIYEYVTGKKEVKNNTIIKTNTKQIKINCKDNIFAQAILLCKVIEKLNKYNLGRVKAEKTLYLIEKDIGFDFDNNYVREAAGPLSESIYKCESVISKKNKWIKVNKVKKHIEYEILSDFSKYSKYYNKYYSNYDNQIEEIIEKVKNYSTDKSEMVATLYASWNDFIIKKEDVTDIKIVKDVRENWNDTKKRFNEQKWLDVLEEMKEIELTPKGNGNLTIIKEN